MIGAISDECTFASISSPSLMALVIPSSMLIPQLSSQLSPIRSSSNSASSAVPSTDDEGDFSFR